MDKQLISILQTEFNQLFNTLKNTTIEYWYTRDLQKFLGYERWENFINAIHKAKTACENSKIEITEHFRDVTKMVSIGSNKQFEMQALEILGKLQ